MGRIVKQLSESTSKHYWYPGEKQEWIRAGVALSVGAAVAATLMMITRNSLTAVVSGCAATLAVSGFNFGRRDARALAGFPNLNDRAARVAAIVYSGRAAWRGIAQGIGAAFMAVLVLNVDHSGPLADWVFPVVPAVVGALGHQAGMIWDRLATTVSTPKPAATAETAPESN